MRKQLFVIVFGFSLGKFFKKEAKILVLCRKNRTQQGGLALSQGKQWIGIQISIKWGVSPGKEAGALRLKPVAGYGAQVEFDLEEPFRHEVFKMLKAEGKINDVVIENMMNWRHSWFNVYCGNAIWPHNEEGLENLRMFGPIKL